MAMLEVFRSENNQNLNHTVTQEMCVYAYTRVYPKVSGLAARSENCKWYGSLPLSAVASLFYESV
jgi:hypothetical protein